MNKEDDVKSLKDLNPVRPARHLPKNAPKRDFEAENIQAALDREEEIKKAEAEAIAKAEAERKNDGREYEMEVEGFNIGDSLVRRARFVDQKVAEAQAVLSEQEAEDEVSGTDNEPSYEETRPVEEPEEYEETADDAELLRQQQSETVRKTHMTMAQKKAVMPEAASEIAATKEVHTKEDNEEVEERDALVVAMEDKNTELPSSQGAFNINEEDLFDDDEREDAAEDYLVDDTEESKDSSEIDTKIMAQLSQQIRETIGAAIPDISELSISNKGVSVNQAIAMNKPEERVADWPLYDQGKLVSMKTFTGAEIDALRSNNRTQNQYNTIRSILKNIYEHIVSEKPAFEKWIRETPYRDLAHYYMAIYRVCYEGSNYIPLSCADDNCDNVFLTENKDVLADMTGFRTEEAEKRFDKIASTGSASPLNKSFIKPISSKLAVKFTSPSLYSALLEESLFTQDFRNKYQQVLNFLTYIDSMYTISNGMLYKITYKQEPNQPVKNAKYRISALSRIINSLDSDAYSLLEATAIEIRNETYGNEVPVYYHYPEETCTLCGKTIPAQEANPIDLVFRRHQLNMLTIQQ